MPIDPGSNDECESSTNGNAVLHYLYFDEENVAGNVAKILEQEGFCVEVCRGADGLNWLMRLRSRATPADIEFDTLSSKLARVAEQHGGDYDGWETEIR